MGTTCTHKPAGMPLEEFFIDHGVLSWRDDLPHRYTVLASAYKMPAFYAAIEQVHKETGERRVFAAIIKVGMYRGDERQNFCYKGMSEDEGPYFHACPARILDLLTPTENQYALEWRSKCRQNLAKAEAKKARKIGVGSILSYGGMRYTVLDVFPRGYLKVCDKNGVHFRMRPGQVRQATLVGQVLEAPAKPSGANPALKPDAQQVWAW